MDGRFFDTRQLVAYTADGSERFRKTNEKKTDIGDGEDEAEGSRLDRFGSWLEEEKA